MQEGFARDAEGQAHRQETFSKQTFKQVVGSAER